MRSAADILGRPYESIAAASPQTEPGVQPNSAPLGSLTGAPPPTQMRTLQVSPGTTPILVVPPERASRVITLTAPFVGFSIYVGGSGVKTTDHALTPGLPYDVVLPGNQELYAVTDAPVSLTLRLQIAPVLTGDRERKFYP